jgi:hypothetical protein
MRSADEMRAALRALSAPAPQEREIPGYGLAYIRRRTSYDTSRHARLMQAGKGTDDDCTTGRALACILCTPEGDYLHDPDNDADVQMLSKVVPDVQAAIFEASREVNGDGETVEQLGNG